MPSMEVWIYIDDRFYRILNFGLDSSSVRTDKHYIIVCSLVTPVVLLYDEYVLVIRGMITNESYELYE